MWRKLSIQLQLMTLMIAVTVTVALSSLAVAFWLDIKERKFLAIELTNTVKNALDQDLINGLTQKDPALFVNLKRRLQGFPKIDRVLVLSTSDDVIFNYQHSDEHYNDLVQKSTDKPRFSGEDLYIRYPLTDGQRQYGSVTFIVDIKSFATQFRQHLIFLVMALPIELLLAMILAWWISRSYNQPFTVLVEAMKRSDVANNRFKRVETEAQNEVGDLFDGYNHMIERIETTTRQIRFQSEHDALTGLYNRFYIENRLRQALTQESDKPHLLLCFDLDRFKLINDAAGYRAGDELLKMLAHSCQEQLPDKAVMARLGGDDFYVLLPDTEAETGLKQAENLRQLLADYRFTWEGSAYSVSATFGVVCFRAHDFTLDELVKATDSAFAEAKSRGRNQLHLYQPDEGYTENHQHQVQVAGWIKDALKATPDSHPSPGTARFELYAQAIKPLQTQTSQLGYEVLLRMHDDQGRLIAPDNFLPTAERYQLMTEVDIFVLNTYVDTVMQQPAHLDKLGLVHVNLSGSSLNHPDFQSNLKHLIQTRDFPWHKLELEVTETAAVDNFNQAVTFIEYCKSQGIGLALDDFGTGMSSFEYLKSLPFDVVKIDGSFVKDMHSDPTDHAVIRYIQEISALRHQKTVAEYVETEQDVRALTDIGVTYGQGYFLGKPKPLTDWF
ncbi:EAL domain-containing protein [Thiomicrospira sp. S5]|uniref:EAL domain-containing protein n=1 Tax=Thiomicrospira sp. S5 TaxID=1803865 RepID=UPI000F89F7E8|nr:EAL domain-containing protein [Thiomicrospira sp. S5]AZR81142.1 diguanylate cyclase [Thiomicrospira sp. S5]